MRLTPTRTTFVAGAALVLAAAAFSAFAASGPRAPYRAPGTAKMAERLAALASAPSLRSPIENTARIGRLESLLRQTSDAAEAITLRTALATERLHAGDSTGAIADLERLRAQVAAMDQPAQGLEARIVDLLALSYLRQGEQENCLVGHNADSCLLPIRDGGVYARTDATRKAIAAYTELLSANPDSLAYRWLLNLAYMTVGEHPESVPEEWRIPASAFGSPSASVERFRDVAPRLGLAVGGRAGGVVVEDFDRDGYLDLMVSSWGLADPIRYFRNEGGRRFAERTVEAGLTGITGGLNLVHADYDNDGDPDVWVQRGAWLGLAGEGDHPSSLLRNNGDGTFADVTEESGLLRWGPSQSAAFADYDGDGWLDLFVGVESTGGPPRPSVLYRSNGDGTFSAVPAEAGPSVVGFVKGVSWGDFNNDGRPDLYISRFGQSNLLFRNDGPRAGDPPAVAGYSGPSWRFTDVTEAAHVAEPRNSFATWFWDYDNDGWQDIFVASFQGFGGRNLAMVVTEYVGGPRSGETPRLFRNQHDGTFADVTKAVGLDKPLLVMGSNFGDIDGDGFNDIYLGTGEPDLATLVPNRMFRNVAGRAFEDVTAAGGFGHLQKGHGIAFADIDHDGDQDIYVALGGAYEGDAFPDSLLLNPASKRTHLTLELEGRWSNRSALGARIRVVVDTPAGERSIHATVSSGGSFGSSPLRQTIGLGNARGIRLVEIRWPTSATTQRFHDAAIGRMYRVREGDVRLAPLVPHPLAFRVKAWLAARWPR